MSTLSEEAAARMVAEYERAVRKLDRMPLGNAEADQAEKVTAMRTALIARLSAPLDPSSAPSDMLELLQEVANSGTESDDPRIGYVTVQIGRKTWEEICEFRGRVSPEREAGSETDGGRLVRALDRLVAIYGSPITIHDVGSVKFPSAVEIWAGTERLGEDQSLAAALGALADELEASDAVLKAHSATNSARVEEEKTDG